MQLKDRLQPLTMTLQPQPNPRAKEPIHTTMQANITMTLLQDIPKFNRQDSSKLEDLFMDIETATDILTRKPHI